MTACFMGLGYIGLPTAVVAARNGIQVHGCDIHPDIVEKTMRGELHFEEPVLGDYLREAIACGKLRAAVTPVVSDTYVIVVPTPFKENHEPDIKYVQSASLMVLPLLKKGDLFIIESTSPVGTTEFIAKMIFEKRPELKGQIYILMSVSGRHLIPVGWKIWFLTILQMRCLGLTEDANIGISRL